jgi:hypothetical protein
LQDILTVDRGKEFAGKFIHDLAFSDIGLVLNRMDFDFVFLEFLMVEVLHESKNFIHAVLRIFSEHRE